MTTTQALSHALYLLTASRGANARLSFEEQVICALAEIIGVDKESLE